MADQPTKSFLCRLPNLTVVLWTDDGRLTARNVDNAIRMLEAQRAVLEDVDGTVPTNDAEDVVRLAIDSCLGHPVDPDMDACMRAISRAGFQVVRKDDR